MMNLDQAWDKYWSGKGYIVCPQTGKFFDNPNYPGIKMLRQYELNSGTRLPMDPQWIIYYQRIGYEVNLQTGELSRAVIYE